MMAWLFENFAAIVTTLIVGAYVACGLRQLFGGNGND